MTVASSMQAVFCLMFIAYCICTFLKIKSA